MLHWYFAYGSNLDTGRLEDRVGRRNIEWRLARLDGYRLSFDKPAADGSGYAMVVPEEGHTVHGVLYALQDHELKKLDKHEGVHKRQYVPRTITIRTHDGEPISAECYFAISPSSGLRPRRDYLDLIINGAEDHGLPPTYIEWLKSVTAMDD
ncbi:MAG: gamma-glutamylcyclotransferase family protein [Nitrospiraceae bacterium]